MFQSSGTLWRFARRLALPPRESTLAKFVFPAATHTARTLADADGHVTLHGHLHRKPRVQAKRTFAELRDANGDVVPLLLAPEHTQKQCFDAVAASGTEDSVSVTGFVKLKPAKDGTPQLELVVTEFQTLNPAGIDASQLELLKQTAPQDIPPQFRYLQLRHSHWQNALKTRSKVAQLVRSVLSTDHDFTEIETPLLFKSTPEGAREFLVPTRSGRFYALPQSPQQYKQILMSSGFTKYFQIARCFRDEDLRADRQPEFTQVDLEMSFISSQKQVTDVVSDLVCRIWRDVAAKPIYTERNGVLEAATDSVLTRMPYPEALSKYGIDKPDLRSALLFVNLSRHFTSNKEDFPVVEACVLKGVGPEQVLVPHVFKDASSYLRRKPVVLPINTESDAKEWYKKFLEKGLIKATEDFDAESLTSLLNLEPGDILAFSTRAEMPYENPTPLGKFRQLAIEHYPGKWNGPLRNANGEVTCDYDRSQVFVGSWVVDFPLFSPVETTGPDEQYPTYSTEQLESTHHPFTMARSEDYELLESDPLAVRGEHYDLVINGVEVGGGSRRIHDPELQRYVFEEILDIKNHHALFGHLIKALSMGCPPHAGLALGFDRLCAMIVGSSSIRDVIAFPKNQSGSDPVVDSPTDVKDDILSNYHIQKRG